MTEKPKILFVDDERQILVSLRALFRAHYKVFLANDGLEALDIIRREPIQAIISDQRMPHMLGHELLREVKNISPGTMRLLLTGYSDLSAIMNSINDGEIFRFIHKPWDNTELRAIVDSAVKIALNTNKTLAAAVAKDQPADSSHDNLALAESTAASAATEDSATSTLATALKAASTPLPTPAAAPVTAAPAPSLLQPPAQLLRRERRFWWSTIR